MNPLFLINLLLALAWVAVTGTFTLVNVVFGFVLGSLVLWIIRDEIRSAGYFNRSRRVFGLAGLFFYELVMSTLRVAWLVVQPRIHMRPGFVAYPLKVQRDFEITLLAQLITLTPGTLSVDVSDDRRFLFIHAVDVPDPEALKADIAAGFERRIMETFR